MKGEQVQIVTANKARQLRAALLCYQFGAITAEQFNATMSTLQGRPGARFPRRIYNERNESYVRI